MPKQILLTIHGVNPDRKWQERTHEVLNPHFACDAITYHEYDTNFGPVRAVFSIPLLIASATLLLIGVAAMFFWGWPTALLLLAGGVVFFASSIFVAWLKRIKCAQFLKQEIDRRCPFGNPHIIAHSLGTYLVGRV